MLLFALSDVVWQAAIACAGSAFLAWIGYMTVKLNTVSKVQDMTHDLVNSQHGIALEVGARSLRKEADRTREPADEAAAVVAENLLREHKERQAVVDAKG